MKRFFDFWKIIFVVLGIYIPTISQSVQVWITSPNQKEIWIGGSDHIISWSCDYPDSVSYFNLLHSISPYNSDTLFFDNFESGSASSARWTRSNCLVNSVGVSEPSGTYSLDVQGMDTCLSIPIDLSYFPDGKVFLYYYYERTGGGDVIESGENFFVEYYDSNQWTIGKTYDYQSGFTNQYTLDSLAIPTNALVSNFRFRFRSTGTDGSFDDYFVDNVCLLSKESCRDTIAANLSKTDTSCLWTLPFISKDNCKIKIQAMDGAGNVLAEDMNDSTLKIEFYTFLTYPNGGENIYGGSSHSVNWSTVGEKIGSYKLLFSQNGSSWDSIISGILPSATNYSWKSPFINSTNCKIKIQTLDGASNIIYEDNSNSNFAIQTNILLKSPTGGDVWLAESTYSVTWSPFAAGFDKYRILLSNNSGLTYDDTVVNITSPTDSSYTWTLPRVNCFTSRVKIQIVNANNVIVENANSSDFTIRRTPYITLNSPNSKEKWTTGTACFIEWGITGGIGDISGYKLLLSKDGGVSYPVSIATGVPADSTSWNWVPSAINCNTCKIKAQIFDDSGYMVSEDISDSVFTIETYPVLTLPNGGEIWTAGSNQQITWTTVGTGYKSFRLLFTTTGNWNNVPYAFSSQHPYPANFDSTWEISQAGIPKMKVHFDTIYTETGCDYVYVRDKSGNQIVKYCSTYGSTWTPEIPGDVAKVQLKSDNTVQKYGFDVDSISYYILANVDTIDSNVPGTSVSYNWKVLPINCPVSWIKLEMLDSSGSVISWDTNDNSFAITFSSKLVYPNGGESWRGSNAYTIKWRVVGNEAVSTYKLVYSTDGGATYPYLIAENITATDSTYDWTTPNIGSDSVRVKLQALNGAKETLLEDYSDGNFEIDGMPPATVDSLEILTKTWDSIDLQWIAPGDDSMRGKATEYDIRYSNATITEANWQSAVQCMNEPSPGTAGSNATHTIGTTGKKSVLCESEEKGNVGNDFVATGKGKSKSALNECGNVISLTCALPLVKTDGTLYANTQYYIAMKTRDNASNWSGLSNVVNCYTNPYPSLANSQYPMFQFNTQHTGSSPYRGILSDNIKWFYGTTNIISSSPVIAPDGTIYFTSKNDSLYAVSSKKIRQWAVSHKVVANSTPAIALDGTIYLGDNTGKLYAYNADKSVKWYFSAGGNIYSPVVGKDGSVFFSSSNGKIYAISPRGKSKWEFSTGGTISSSPAMSSDGVIYIGANNHKFYAITPTGSKMWEVTISSDIQSSPSIDSLTGVIYVGGCNGKLYAINPNGTIKWFYSADDTIVSSPAISKDGAIIFGSYDRKVYALNPSDGTIKWSYQTSSSIKSSPTIDADGMIYIGNSEGIFHCLNGSNGSLKWQGITGDAIVCASSIASDSTVYVGSNDGRIYAYGSSAPVVLKTPNGGENVVKNTVYNIQWEATGNVNNIKLYYSLNSGSSWISISETELNDGIYLWKVPDTLSTTCRVKVIAYTSVDSAWDISDSDFSIAVGIEDKPIVPTIFFVQSYPNPFKLTTDIRYGLPKDANVDISIYNLSGQKVISLENGLKKAGRYVKRWNGKDQNGKQLASGIYFYKFDTPYYKKINKVYLIR